MEPVLDFSQDEWVRILLKEEFRRDAEGPGSGSPSQQPLQDTSWIGSYERVYMERNLLVLQEYRSALQFPPAGPITYKDLKWEYRVPNGSAEALASSDWTRVTAGGQDVNFGAAEDVEGKIESMKDGVERRSRIAYIPWDRVQDLLTGEERHRSDVDTKFLRRLKGKGPGKSPRHDTGLVTYWYECQYGPRDLSGRVMEITPDMKTLPPRYDLKGKLLPNGRGHSQKRKTSAGNGGSIKKGCVCKFQVKQLYYVRDIAEIVYTSTKVGKKNRTGFTSAVLLTTFLLDGN